jgi:hypothetical protein
MASGPPRRPKGGLSGQELGALRRQLEAICASEVEAFVAVARLADSEPGKVFDLVEDAARQSGTRIARAMVAGAANLAAAGAEVPAVCPVCGDLVGAHSVRSKTITTMSGPVRLDRVYCYCRACRVGFFPADRLVGVEDRTTSGAFDKAVTASLSN